MNLKRQELKRQEFFFILYSYFVNNITFRYYKNSTIAVLHLELSEDEFLTLITIESYKISIRYLAASKKGSRTRGTITTEGFDALRKLEYVILQLQDIFVYYVEKDISPDFKTSHIVKSLKESDRDSLRDLYFEPTFFKLLEKFLKVDISPNELPAQIFEFFFYKFKHVYTDEFVDLMQTQKILILFINIIKLRYFKYTFLAVEMNHLSKEDILKVFVLECIYISHRYLSVSWKGLRTRGILNSEQEEGLEKLEINMEKLLKLIASFFPEGTKIKNISTNKHLLKIGRSTRLLLNEIFCDSTFKKNVIKCIEDEKESLKLIFGSLIKRFFKNKY